MGIKETEAWIGELLTGLFDLFDENDLYELAIPDIKESDDPARFAAESYARCTHDVICRQMDYIPVNSKIDMETLERKQSKDKVSRIRGFLLYYTPKKCSEEFGVHEMNELWLLEDGRLAEVTSVCFVQDKYFNNHRKFRKIVKHKKDLWFKAQDLQPAFYLISLSQMGFPGL